MGLWMADVLQEDFRNTDEIFREVQQVRNRGGNIDSVVYRYVSKPSKREVTK